MLDKLTYAGNLDNLRDVAGDPRYTFVKGDICDAGDRRPGRGRRRRHRQLRGRDPRRPLHQRPRRLHPHRRDRHARAARGGARPRRRALRADLDRRGLRRHRRRARRSRPTRCVPRAPTRPARPAASSSCWPTGAPTARRSSSRAAPTTTAPGSTPRRSCRCSSPTRSTACRCRSTATAATCATGSTSTTTARALDLVLRSGADGEVYNVGGGNEVANLDLTRGILAELGLGEELVRYVADRPGPRPPLRARLRQAARPGLGAAGRLRRGPGAHRGLVRGAPRLVGEDQVGRVAQLLRAPVRGPFGLTGGRREALAEGRSRDHRAAAASGSRPRARAWWRPGRW